MSDTTKESPPKISEAGQNRYITKRTIELVDDCLRPHLSRDKERDVGFSEAIHEAAVFYKNKNNLISD